MIKKNLSQKIYFFLFIIIAFSSCQKSDVTKNSKIMSFNEYAKNNLVSPTNSCSTEKCKNLKTEFNYVTYVAEKIYCYWDEKQVAYNIDFKQQAQIFSEQITNETTSLQYFYLLTKWAALFKDGHVNAMLKDDLSDIELYNLPIRLEILAPGTDHEQLIVSKANSSLTNLKIGTIIDTLQGQKWQTYINDAEKFVSGSTARMRHLNLGNAIFKVLLEKEGPKPIEVTGTFKNNSINETVIRTISPYATSNTNSSEESTGAELLTVSILKNNIGYLRIDGFSGSQLSSLLNQAMNSLSQTDALLIDVRKNGGGDLSGNVVISHLINSSVLRFTQKVLYSDFLISRRSDVILDYNYISGKFSEITSRQVKPYDLNKTYMKPVYVLSSPFCFSACDTFVSSLKENKLATVVGEGTGGGTGNPLAFSLPYSEHSFRYSVAQGFTPVTNQMIEGNGTLPDITIEPTVEERANQKDLQLEKTMQLISDKLKENSSNTAMQKVDIPSNLINTKIDNIISTPDIEDNIRIKKYTE